LAKNQESANNSLFGCHSYARTNHLTGPVREIYSLS
jgi:hypothetical protein